MNDVTLLRHLQLGPAHRPTGKTRQFGGGQMLPVPTFLQIVQYSGDPGVYLLYLDEDKQEITDTYYESLHGTLEQAHWEFSVGPDEWVTSA